MGPLNRIVPRDSICGIDSCLFIYLLADRAPYAEAVQPFLKAVHQGEITAITSVITLTEVLAKPEQNKQADLVRAYSLALRGIDHLQFVEIDETIARHAAHLRGVYGFRTPDALQLAAALHKQCSFFVTNDRRLQRMQELNIIVLDDVLTA
ncbi:MAG: type II toxin-antitoxin system VapC family toxin [Patescibacteria group bacterium]